MTTGERGEQGSHGSMGERGPMGDHGQQGADGREGRQGNVGRTGDTGPIGPPGSVLTKKQTLAGFGFVVLAFCYLGYLVGQNGGKITDGVERQDRYLNEVCQRQPDLAPVTCAENR